MSNPIKERRLLHGRPGHWSHHGRTHESITLTTILENGDSGPGVGIRWIELGNFGVEGVLVPSHIRPRLWSDNWSAIRELPEVFEILGSIESTDLESVKSRLLAAGWTEVPL